MMSKAGKKTYFHYFSNYNRDTEGASKEASFSLVDFGVNVNH